MAKRYLVTGASGFIGKALCQYLQSRGDIVCAMLRKSMDGPWDEIVICDLVDTHLPKGMFNGIDGVFHLAGIAHDLFEEKKSLYFEINVKGTEILLEAAGHAGVKGFVYFSSTKAVGTPEPTNKCVDEQWDVPPADDYGASKLEAEKKVLLAGQYYGMHVCNLRPTLVYGQDFKGNLQRMFKAIERGYFPPIPENGNQRSMISLDDLIAAAVLAMLNPAANAKTYIISDAVHYSTREIYEAMCKALAREIPRWNFPIWILRIVAFVGDVLKYVLKKDMPFDHRTLSRLTESACFESVKIQTELGWVPKKTFFEEIRVKKQTATR